jgi:DNA polymerase
VAFACFGGFEPVVWSKVMVERHMFPPIPSERWVDLRAACCAFALPRSLDKALAALGLPIEKDKEGQRLVRSLSSPNRRTGAYPELAPAILERVAAYNRIDILALEAMRARGLGHLSAAEQAVWELDQKINARGIAIDTAFVKAAKRIADQVMGEAVAEFVSLTKGVLPSQVQKIREWLRDQRCALPNLESETVSEALETALPGDVRRVLEIRQIAAAASLKKLDAMLACAGPDGRARGLLQYHGAVTGRWSGQLIQPQNFPRPTLEIDPEELTAAVKTGDPVALSHWGKPVDVLVSSVRCALTAAEGKLFGAGDFSMIEACVLLALAGQRDKCALIAQGVDVYRDMAATIYGLDRAAFMAISEDELSPEQAEQRRIGKSGVLSCGYGIGGEGFYRRFCRHTEGGRELATRIIGVYRNQWAPAAPRLWRDLEWAARQAMLRPNMTANADCGVVYRLTTRAGLPCLVCELLNGKLLHYANARLGGHDKFDRPRWVYDAYRQGRWDTYEPYGGQLTEHVVSALARELLVDRMFALEAAGYPIVFTVHDEIVVERTGVAKETMERIMSERPPWAEKLGVPVKAKAWVGKRYRK